MTRLSGGGHKAAVVPMWQRRAAEPAAVPVRFAPNGFAVGWPEGNQPGAGGGGPCPPAWPHSGGPLRSARRLGVRGGSELTGGVRAACRPSSNGEAIRREAATKAALQLAEGDGTNGTYKSASREVTRG
jgi:hypothetical protein